MTDFQVNEPAHRYRVFKRACALPAEYGHQPWTLVWSFTDLASAEEAAAQEAAEYAGMKRLYEFKVIDADPDMEAGGEFPIEGDAA